MEAKAHPFPVLSSDCLGYQDSVSYSARIFRRGKGGNISVEHHLSDDNLIASLVKNGGAKFACAVSVPSTMFRAVFTNDDAGIQTTQSFDCGEGNLSDEAKFRPIVICTGGMQSATVCESYRLDEFYAGQTIQFPDGAIIADGGWKRFGGLGGSILVIRKADENLESGKFWVEDSTENGFQFIVKVAADIYDALQKPGENKNHCISVLTHALSSGLALVAKRYRDNWREFQNLQMVHRDLEEKNEKTWEDEDFSPERAATTIYPHRLTEEAESVDEGE